MNEWREPRPVLVGEHIAVMPRHHKVQRTEYLSTGLIPVVDQSAQFIAGYINDEDLAYDGPLPIIVFGDHTCTLKYVDFRFAVGADGTQLIRPTDLFDPRYLYYCLLDLRLEHFGYQRHFKYLREATILWRQEQEQRKIAAILSAYDDLIENNTRRIAILEDMARLLYREWFVNFCFPGHHHVPMVDSPLGPIPEGWEPITVRDVSSYINRGVSPTYADKSSSLVINQKCIRDSRLNLEHARTHTSRVPSDKHVRFGDVLINSTGIGTLGRVAQVYRTLNDCTVDSHVSIVRPNERVGVDYFGFYLLSLQPYFDSQGTGSTGQTELAREMIGKASFLLPPSNLQDHFGLTVAPMRTCCETLAKTNTNLRHTRDLLLPRLISGEIDVSELPIGVAEIDP